MRTEAQSVRGGSPSTWPPAVRLIPASAAVQKVSGQLNSSAAGDEAVEATWQLIERDVGGRRGNEGRESSHVERKKRQLRVGQREGAREWYGLKHRLFLPEAANRGLKLML